MEQGGTFLQGYSGNLVPMLEQVRRNCGSSVQVVTADSGYWSPEAPARSSDLGTGAYIATERRKHWDRDDSLTQGSAPEGTDPRTAMRWELRTREGRDIYARRKAVVEPVSGQIKEARGVRRLLLRGLEAVRAEWQLICLGHNLLKLHRYG